eukprot:3259587-Pyramimonas_sp.AAC.1
MRNVIDDVSIQALGAVAFVSEQLGKAAIMMKDGFEKLKFILSGKKTKYIFSSKQLSSALALRWAKF